ncbi:MULTISPECIES: IucA/IucC family protein [unclassified Staphylococcus]|uniref:IucA/IucC family protein n=1 Tax=unclassified Staphylococcus TaxID=91994 RepID=UPI0021D08CD1|nr:MULTISPECIES: IucA/IucC family protein [unclassified Staphylococcus]UXR69204.1 sialic acid synthase [Staphylococcus sp. IVB6246]UXR71259.1 sialic acid synthase [Staphylococcus sp. IVB6240]UXR75851.1 sialic acid synthase [Staphylococcus sp. IVB6233]UXR80049.1 sialic acid synthase [Staphylococcus sp. IVB6218]
MNAEQKQMKESATIMTRDEQETYETLYKQNPNWAASFQKLLSTGRDLVTARVITSIYRENLVNGYTNSQTVDHSLLSTSPLNHVAVLEIQFLNTQTVLCAPISGSHAFNRIDVSGPFYWRHNDQYERISHPNDVLDVIIAEDAQYQGPAAEQFRDDLSNSACYMTLAISYQQLKYENTSDTLLTAIEQQQNPYLASEQAVVEGHPIHPGAKLRKGMTADETIAFSSEYEHAMPLRFILVHKDYVRVQQNDKSLDTILYEAFDGLEAACQHAGEVTQRNLHDYQLMVVHPWQYDHILSEDYVEELQNQVIIPVSYTYDYYAGLSFRTLMPKLPKQLPHIKLSTNVHITGEIRTLSEQTTHNGPLMSQILRDITTNDTWFSQVPASAVDELAGVHFFSTHDETDAQERRSEQLGTLLRHNIYHDLEDTDLPLIPSSLIVGTPQQDSSLIIELVERYRQHHLELDQHTAIQQWFSRYAAALIDYEMPLLIKYGIALEAHLQNTIAVFNKEDGLLKHMYIRDFEGLRIDEAQLNKMGYDTSHFHEKSRILTNSQKSVFNKAFYATVQNHLGELVVALSDYYDMPSLEMDLWQIVRHHIQSLFKAFYENDFDAERLHKIEDIFFNPVIDYKCVTTMRLLDEAHAYTYVKVDNPLALE